VNKIQAGTMAVMALSGTQLPQVSPNGSVSGTLHIVTSDGAGPYKALIDTTGTGNFTNAKTMEVLTQVPGKKGNIKKTTAKRGIAGLWGRAISIISRRATNINEDFVSDSRQWSAEFKLGAGDANCCHDSLSRSPSRPAQRARVPLQDKQTSAWSSSSTLLMRG
jgi:hypothetical protein